MTRRAQNVDIHTGDTRTLRIRVFDGATSTNPKDLTGASGVYAVRNKPGGDLLFQKVTGAGGGIAPESPPGVDGWLLVTISSIDTKDVPIDDLFKDYFHELELVIAGAIATGMEGRFRLRKSVAGVGAA